MGFIPPNDGHHFSVGKKLSPPLSLRLSSPQPSLCFDPRSSPTIQARRCWPMFLKSSRSLKLFGNTFLQAANPPMRSARLPPRIRHPALCRYVSPYPRETRLPLLRNVRREKGALALFPLLRLDRFLSSSLYSHREKPANRCPLSDLLFFLFPTIFLPGK